MKKYFIKNRYKLFSVLILICTILLYKSADLIIFAKNSNDKRSDVYLVDVFKIPVKKGIKNTVEDLNEFNIANLTSKSVYIEDIDSATPLFEKNAERILLPASTTKLMTALVVRDVFDLDQTMTVPDISQIDSLKLGLFNGEKILVRELLKAALIQSSNDAAYTLAMNYPEGLDGFVSLMNLKAKGLNLKSTFFDNPVGFDSNIQKSSAHDLAIISKEFMKDEFLRNTVGTQQDTITDLSGAYQHKLQSTHKLLGVDKSVIGIKTGTTDGASQVLITQFNREGKNILIVVMGSDDRYQETSQLINWVFDEFEWLTPEEIIEKS